MFMNRKLSAYWFTLDISFDPPLEIVGECEDPKGENAYGAILEIGVTDVSEEDAKYCALSFVHEIGGWDRSQYSVTFSRVGILDKDAMQKDIYGAPDVKDSLIQDPSERGVWYKSGFGFYTDEDE
jgi:hypothetical protein